MKPQPGTQVRCSCREGLIGTVVPDNDPRIWTNTLAFRGTPTQEQVDKHIAWCIANGLSFGNETAVDYGDNCLQWDSTDSLSAVSERGQSLVEFALALVIVVVIGYALGILANNLPALYAMLRK